MALVQGCSPAARLAAQAPLPVLLSCRASASTLNMPPLLQIRCLPRCRLCTWLATRLRRTLSPMWPTPAHRRLWGAVTGCSTRRAYRSRRSTGLGENDEAAGCHSACGMHAMWQGIPTCQHGCPSMPLCCSHARSTTLRPPPRGYPRRAPFLLHNAATRRALAAAGFLYDSSLPDTAPSAVSPSVRQRAFPYRMDAGIPQACETGGC